jgi:hypothetical protein
MRTIAMVLILATFIFGGCDMCGEDKLAETNSPSNKYVATVFRRGCGATSGFLYHVNLRSSTSSFSGQKGAIKAGQIFLTREGKISVSWRDDTTLHVTCEGCPKDRKPEMETAWNDVTISYDLH